MSNPIDDGGPIAATLHGPEMTVVPTGGLSLRDWFAGMALSAFANTTETDWGPELWRWNVLARTAYVAADAMLAAREGRDQ